MSFGMVRKDQGDYLALARLLPCLPSPYKMRGSNMGTNTMTTSDKAFKITVYITGHDMKNVSDATHMSLPSELLDSVTRKYREESVDSSITLWTTTWTLAEISLITL